MSLTTNNSNHDFAFIGRLLDQAKIGSYYADYRRCNEIESESLMPYETFLSSGTYKVVKEAGDFWCETRDLFRVIEMVPKEILRYFKFVFDTRKDPDHSKNEEPTPEQISERQTALFHFFGLEKKNIGLTRDECASFMRNLLDSTKQVFYLTFSEGRWFLEIWTQSSDDESRVYYTFIVKDAAINNFIETFPGRHHSFTSYF